MGVSHSKKDDMDDTIKVTPHTHYGSTGRGPSNPATHTSFVDEDRVSNVITFGKNKYGELGIKDMTVPICYPVRVSYFDGKDVQLAVAGAWHTLVLTDDNKIVTFGWNFYGQLGHTGSKPKVIDPFDCKISVTQVIGGYSHSVFFTEEGHVYTLGSSRYGQLGHGDYINVSTPKLLTSMIGHFVVRGSAGDYHTVLLTDESQIYSFGYGNSGQLGVGSRSNFPSPQHVSALANEKIKQVAAAGCATIILTEEGRVYTCGSGKCGRLGHGTTQSETHPKLVEGLMHERIVQVGAGGCHNIVLSEQGNVYTFGQGTFGQLGHNSNQDEHKPRMISSLEEQHRVVQVDAGYKFSIVLTDEGHVYTFGNGADGQLGHGDTGDTWVPKQVKLNNLANTEDVIENENGEGEGEEIHIKAISANGAHSVLIEGVFDNLDSTYGDDMFRMLINHRIAQYASHSIEL